IKNGHVICMDPSGSRYQNADIAIKDGVITAIGPQLSMEVKTVIDAAGNAVMPGLIDCHMHETLLRGLMEDLPLMRWLNEICFPKDRAFQPHHQRAAAMMAQLEMIRGGITTFIDIFRYPGVAAEVAEASGLRGIFSPQLIDDPLGPGETLESSLAFIEEWRDRCPGRIMTWFGPHSLYTVQEETMRQMQPLAEKYGVGVHIHLAETRDEFDQCMTKHGRTPTQRLADFGLHGPRVLAAHGVHLTDEDMQILVALDIAVAHNPSSNMKLASGVARIPDLIDAGVRVGLGTDSNLSNNNLDMFEEMRLAAMLQKLSRSDAASMPVDQMMRMATINGAACLCLQDQVGSLELGKRADVIIVDLHAPHMWPVLPEPASNVIEQLVYSANAGDVLTTIVDGQVLMRDREIFSLDVRETEALVLEAAQDLIKLAGIQL
ncbi:MAG: amidohydrolase, partial [Anaerolineaceae bacterium]|nr:amidohydrolase [Anaerolineaceae bacterium]